MPKLTVTLVLSLTMIMIAGCSDTARPRIVSDAGFYRATPKISNHQVDIPEILDATGPQAWLPLADRENKSRWQAIVIHHSGTSYGSAAHEDQYHRSIGWDGLGYDFVINNGIYKNGYGQPDGLVEVGYRWTQQKTGSHCRVNGDASNYWNEHSIGICLIGDCEKTYPTQMQKQSLLKLVKFLQQRYNIPQSRIKGHGDIKPTKCPGRYFPMEQLKAALDF